MIADFQLNYDAAQDRLQLTLVVSGTERLFWLTRRQCLGILAAVRRAAGEPPPLKFAPPIGSVPKQASTSSAKQGDGALDEPVQADEPTDNEPQLVKLGLQDLPQGIRMTLTPLQAPKMPPVRVLLKPQDQLALAKTLRHLGQRAQWDFSVAEPREVANALLKDVQRVR